MIQVNVMPSFLGRLRDRGWKNVNVRGYTGQNIQVLQRGESLILAVENVTVDASVDIGTQIEVMFRNLMEIVEKTKYKIKDIFLPGGGDIPVPEFFKTFCDNCGIRLTLIGIENFRYVMNFD
jgi:hypothetical protein